MVGNAKIIFKSYGKKKHLFNYHDGYHGFWYCIDLQFMGIMERMAHNMGNGSKCRDISSRRINWGIYKTKYIVMEAKKYYKVGVLDMHNRERIFRLEAYSKYHALDKVYTSFCIEVGDRSRYYVIKESK